MGIWEVKRNINGPFRWRQSVLPAGQLIMLAIMLPPQLWPIQFSPPAPLNTALLDPNSNWEGRRISFFKSFSNWRIFFSQNHKIWVRHRNETSKGFQRPGSHFTHQTLTLYSNSWHPTVLPGERLVVWMEQITPDYAGRRMWQNTSKKKPTEGHKPSD